MSAQGSLADCFTDEHREALQEITNIGMGHAGNSLARILGVFVELSIPNIRIVSPDSIATAITEMLDIQSDVTAVRQGFFNHWHGEAIIIYDHHGCEELAELMGYPADLDADSEVELFLDVGNVQVAACLNGIADILGIELKYSAPSMLATNIAPQDLFMGSKLEWTTALLMEVNFGLEERPFKSHLIVMLSEESIQTLCNDIERFIEQL